MHAHCKALAAQLEAAQDPAAALSIAVPLLAAQVAILVLLTSLLVMQQVCTMHRY